jgi:hypothetical protein
MTQTTVRYAVILTILTTPSQALPLWIARSAGQWVSLKSTEPRA